MNGFDVYPYRVPSYLDRSQMTFIQMTVLVQAPLRVVWEYRHGVRIDMTLEPTPLPGKVTFVVPNARDLQGAVTLTSRTPFRFPWKEEVDA